MKDKKAVIFYFLMTVILFDFGSQIKRLTFNSNIYSINNPVFSIVHTNNTGSAFSMFENSALILAVIGLIALIVLSYCVYRFVSFNDKFILLASTLFAAGTFGNAAERLQHGAVIDYIKLNFINFPIFNTFDIMITLGIFIYFAFSIYEIIKAKNEN